MFPPSAERPGDVTSGFDAPALAACPVCLERPSPEPDVHETTYQKKTYPCCGAFTHLGCMVQAARLHGRCTNCRAAIDHLPREPSVAERCQDLGISLEFASARLPARSTAHAEVRDYATRTFSRVDAPEPSEPAHVRVVCCRRLAGRAMGFTEYHAVDPATSHVVCLCTTQSRPSRLSRKHVGTTLANRPRSSVSWRGRHAPPAPNRSVSSCGPS
eukprot:s12131_g1.t1